MAYNYYQPYQNQYMSPMQVPQMMAPQQQVGQQMPQQIQQMPQMQQPQAIQQPQFPVVQGGFVRVPNENEARMYPVAPGTSVTFIDENAPYCYTKTMDRSQLDRPKFEKYRLVKEEDAPVTAQNGQEQASKVPDVDLSGYATKAEIDAFKDEIEDRLTDMKALQSDLKNLRDRVEILAEKKTPVRKDVKEEKA